MRYSTLLASSLAVGALARPHLDQRARRYHIVFETVTLTVTLLTTSTVDRNLPTPPPGINAPTGLAPTPPFSNSTNIAAPGIVTITDGLSPSSTASGPIVASGTAPASFIGQPTTGSTGSPNNAVTPSVVLPPAGAPTSTAPSNVGPSHITGSAQAALQTGTDYMNAVLYHHNAARANHGSGEMTWCTDCETAARVAAETCNFEHLIPPGVNQGQNLFTVSGDYFNVTAGITESWYKNELPFFANYYGQPNVPDNVFEQVGHFTQVVWLGSTSVGCVSMDCTGRMIVNGASSNLDKFTVCNYSPAGNVDDEYDSNVFPPLTNNLGSWDD